MVNGFTKSKEGVAEYSKIGISYEPHLQDTLYENWLTETRADNLSHYTSHKERELNSLHIILVQDEPGKKPTPFLVYGFIHRRLDPACNVLTRSVTNQGMYPRPIPHWKVTQMSFGKEERKVEFVESIETCYSIKATKANLERIVKDIGWPKDGKVSLGIVAPNGVRFSIKTFEDMLDAINNPNSYLPADQRIIAEIARKRTEGNVLQERPVTASEVQAMLEQSQQQKEQEATRQFRKWEWKWKWEWEWVSNF